MTKKFIPTYDLDEFRKASNTLSKLNATTAAVQTAAELGFTRKEIVQTIQTMRKDHFHHSMTSYANHKIWQDVYHVPSKIGILYIKFTVGTVVPVHLPQNPHYCIEIACFFGF